jgi:predicted anti-sigma-YlaC factor YlaD
VKELTHQRVQRLIAEGTDTKKDTPTCNAIRAHLSSCDECRAYLQSLEKTIDCYKSYPVVLPQNAREKLEKTLSELTNIK